MTSLSYIHYTVLYSRSNERDSDQSITFPTHPQAEAYAKELFDDGYTMVGLLKFDYSSRSIEVVLSGKQIDEMFEPEPEHYTSDEWRQEMEMQIEKDMAS